MSIEVCFVGTCLTHEGDMCSIFYKNETLASRLFDMITACSSVQIVENDGLPSQMCSQCVHSVTQAFSFRQLCERSDSKLRSYLSRRERRSSSSQSENDDSSLPGFEIILIKTDEINGKTKRTSKTSEENSKRRKKVKELRIKKEEHVNSCENVCGEREKCDDDTEQPLYPCSECTRCFTTYHDLKVHKQTHTKSVQHICKICQQHFSSSSSLSRHFKIHAGVKPHLCSECGKGFTRSDDLTQHMRTHTGERPYVCRECFKSFTQSSQLQEHLRAHANEKSFVCTTCGKAFSRYNSLSGHMKIHLGSKTYPCGVCGKGWMQRHSAHRNADKQRKIRKQILVN
ncbi:Parkin Interacting Substrate [Carabus blaptoides fortunei]